MYFQANFIKAYADLNKHQQTYQQGGYTSARANKMVVIQDLFFNLAQDTLEYQTSLTTLMIENSTLTKQVELYTNQFSAKESDNGII